MLGLRTAAVGALIPVSGVRARMLGLRTAAAGALFLVGAVASFGITTILCAPKRGMEPSVPFKDKEWRIRQFYDGKKCLACEKVVSSNGIQRLRDHLDPDRPTPLCTRMTSFPAIDGVNLGREDVLAIVQLLTQQASASGTAVKRARHAADGVAMRLLQPYQEQTIPPAYSLAHASEPEIESAASASTNAAVVEAARDTYRRNSNWLSEKYTHEQCGLQMARATVCGGLPHSWADGHEMRHFLKMYRETPTWQLPGRMTLGAKLIPHDYDNVQSHVDALIAKIVRDFGIAQASDGVTGHRHRSIMSYLTLLPTVPIFHRLEYTNGVTKDMQYIADRHSHICSEIEGKTQVKKNSDLVLIDGACRSLAGIWQRMVPYSTVGICAGHSADLLCEYIGMLPIVSALIVDWNMMGNFVMNHEKPQAWFEKYSKQLTPTECTAHFPADSERREARVLTRPAETRFGTSFLLGASLRDTKTSLVATVSDALWAPWAQAQTYRDLAKQVKDTVNNDDWWDATEATLALLEPAYKLIRTADSNVAAMDIIYCEWYAVSDLVSHAAANAQNLPYFNTYDNTAVNTTLANTNAGTCGLGRAKTTNLVDDCKTLCAKRFDYSYNDYWGAGYALAPHCMGVDHTECDECILDSLETVCNRLFYDDLGKAAKAYADFNLVYKAPNSPFKDPVRVMNIKGMPSYEWWKLYAKHAPELAYVACHVLSKPVGVGAVERAHKKLKSVVARKHRNKLTANNQNKQVYVNMNGPTIAKVSSPDYIQPWSTMEDSSSDDEDSSDDSESSDDEDGE